MLGNPTLIESQSATQGAAVMAPPVHWYAIHIRSKHEKTAAAHLREKGIITFLPVIAQMHPWSDRRKKVELPLFPCYVFVRLAHSVELRLAVLKTPGVLDIVGNHGCGIPIPDKEIEDIQTLLAHNFSCTIHPFLRIGRRVRIRGGCLDGLEGVLVDRHSDRSLIVSIELIQQSVAMRIDGYDVEPI